MLRFLQEEGRDAALQKLNEVDHRIAIGGEAVNDAIGIIEKIFASTDHIALTDAVKARAADRAIAKTAPFHRQRNGIDDAIIIESYIDAVGDLRCLRRRGARVLDVPCAYTNKFCTPASNVLIMLQNVHNFGHRRPKWPAHASF